VFAPASLDGRVTLGRSQPLPPIRCALPEGRENSPHSAVRWDRTARRADKSGAQDGPAANPSRPVRSPSRCHGGSVRARGRTWEGPAARSFPRTRPSGRIRVVAGLPTTI
jgi:hypothetical protein